MTKNISDKVIQRLTLYHSILLEHIKNGEKTITSSYIANLLKVDDSQVRKDISKLNNAGKSRVGYLVDDLKVAIEKTLGFKKPKNAFIVGAGNLGMALAKYDNFTNYGLNVLALFDNDPLKIGNTISGAFAFTPLGESESRLSHPLAPFGINQKDVFHISKLPELAKKMNVEMIILTVPGDCAQSVVDALKGSQIKYIWNFSPCVLKVDENVEVWNENLMGNFLRFSYKFGSELKP